MCANTLMKNKLLKPRLIANIIQVHRTTMIICEYKNGYLW